MFVRASRRRHVYRAAHACLGTWQVVSWQVLKHELLLEVLPLGVLLHLRLQVLRLQPHARYFSITIDADFIEESLWRLMAAVFCSADTHA